MGFFLDILIDCVSGTLLFTPLWVFACRMTGRRMLSLYAALVLLYVSLLFAVFSVTGLPTVRYLRLDFTVNYVPFSDVLESPVQYLLNILMFLPFGVLLPLLWERYGRWRSLLSFGFFLTVFIEAAQVFTYRATDIDDLTANMLGLCLGRLLLQRVAGRLGFALPLCLEGAGQNPWREAGRLLAEAFAVWFFLSPFLSDFIWGLIL